MALHSFSSSCTPQKNAQISMAAQEQQPKTPRGLLGRLSTPLKQAATLLGSTVGLTRSSSAGPSPEEAGEDLAT